MFSLSNSQTLYKSDYIETYDTDWSGTWWTPAPTTGYYTNAYVSFDASSVIYGNGSGSSAYESDWYSFPNISVDPLNEYHFKFRLGSYRFSSTSSTRGVDAGDYITVQLSTDGGLTYVNELRITGQSNAYWNYNTNASYVKTADGTLTTIGPSGSGDRTSTGDGYSDITLVIPPGNTTIAIDVFARVNAAGEEWWMDNFELYEIEYNPLPVELISFTAKNINERINLLRWSTASEHNSSHFILQRSTTGYFKESDNIGIIQSSGNSTILLDYSYTDESFERCINYYKLIQEDFDGKRKEYPIIAIDNRFKIKNIKYCIDISGRIVELESATGLIYLIYEDGTIERIFKS